MSDYLCVDVERARYLHNSLGRLFVGVYLHPVSHIEHFVHFSPVSLALLVYHSEQRWCREQVVLYHVEVVYKVQHFGLCTAATVYHAVYLASVVVQYLLDDRSVCPRGRKHHLAGIHSRNLGAVGEFLPSAVNHFARQALVVRHRIFLGIEMGKDVMPCRGEAVAPHSSVVGFLISRLTVGGKSHYHVAGLDVPVVYHFAALHPRAHRGIHYDGPHQVSHVGCLSSCQVDANSQLSHLCQEFLGAVDDGGYYLAGHQVLVPSYRRRKQYIVGSSDAQQVVEVHHHRVDGYPFPHAQVARLFPVEVGQTRLRSRTVGMHDVAIVLVAAQQVGQYLAKCFRIQSFVYVLYGVVHILLVRTHASCVIFFHILGYLFNSHNSPAF